MVAEGLWLSYQQRRTFHQPRLRRESFGELVQIDGSQHCWFKGRADPCTLLVFINDATSRLMQLRFVLSESASSCFEMLHGYLERAPLFPVVSFEKDRRVSHAAVLENKRPLTMRSRLSRHSRNSSARRG